MTGGPQVIGRDGAEPEIDAEVWIAASATVRRELSDAEVAANVGNAADYRRLASVHADAYRIDYRQSAVTG